jgi:hypothetical protein
VKPQQQCLDWALIEGIVWIDWIDCHVLDLNVVWIVMFWI